MARGLKTDSEATNPASAGFVAYSVVQAGVDDKPDWADVGKWIGPSGRNIFTPNNLPAINSSVGGGIAGEFGNKEINDFKNQIGGKK